MKTLINNTEVSLKQRDVTASSNGYPEPLIGQFYYGFDNIEQARQFADEVTGEVRFGKWKDGWNGICELGGYAIEEMSPSSDDYGDNYTILYGAEDISNYFVDDSMDEEDLADIKQKSDAIIEKCKHVDWDKEAVVLYGGRFYDRVPLSSMSFYYDTRHITIGVFVANQDED